MCPSAVKWSSRYFPNREELLLIIVRAFPNASMRGLTWGKKTLLIIFSASSFSSFLWPQLFSRFLPSPSPHLFHSLSTSLPFSHFTLLLPLPLPLLLFPPLPPFPHSQTFKIFSSKALVSARPSFMNCCTRILEASVLPAPLSPNNKTSLFSLASSTQVTPLHTHTHRQTVHVHI